MVNEQLLETLDAMGFGADVNALENYIIQLNEAAALGEPLVPDGLYDTYVSLLKQLRPESIVFFSNWESEDEELDDLDEMLNEYGMASIETVTSDQELQRFASNVSKCGKSKVDLLASIKLNGHAGRAVYRYGKLHRGTTRGRIKKGRDVTKHLGYMVPDEVEKWKKIPLVEVRGEFLVSIKNFKEKLEGITKTPLSSVTSLIRDSASDEDMKLLEMVCYKVLSSGLKFNTLLEEMAMLRECGFKIPPVRIVRNADVNDIISSCHVLLDEFEQLREGAGIEYDADGVVVAVNDNEVFYGMGKEGKCWKANVALKMGKYWDSRQYKSKIIRVEVVRGKKYLTPKAIIQPTVVANGATVTVVPLHNVGIMEQYGLVPGADIYFKFGGEQGVKLCDSNGNKVAKE